MRFTLIAVLTLAANVLFAQSTFKRNDIYFELGGNGLFASFDYERQLTKEPGLGVRLGVGLYTEYDFYLTIPVGLNYLFELKNKKSFIEAGAGVTFSNYNGVVFGKDEFEKENSWVAFIPSVGFRRHTKRNVMWRVNVAPVLNKYGIVPWAGISIGKRF